MAEKGKLVSRKPEEVLPANLNETIVGQENIEPGDIVFPRIRLLQPISVDVVENRQKAGVFQNSMTGEAVESMDILIFYYFKSRILFNRAANAGEGIACMSMDGKTSLDGKKCPECGLSMWESVTPEQRSDGMKPGGPKCDMGHNFPCLVLNSSTPDIPVALTLRRTSTLQAKQLISLVKLSRVQWWTNIFRVTSKLTKNKKGNFYVFEVKPVRKATDEEARKGLVLFQGLVGKKITVHEDERDDFRGVTQDEQ